MSLIQKARRCIKWFVPNGIIEMRKTRHEIESLRLSKFNHIKDAIRNYFLSLDKEKQSDEVASIISYLKNHNFSVFPYEFSRIYHADEINVFYDESSKMKFVLHNGKKLFFPKHFSIDAIRAYYNGLLIEQDKRSPHCYYSDTFKVENGDVLADIGAAEGIWALTNIDMAKYLYLFECNEQWIKALQKTFEPYKEKVKIINKYVSDTNDKYSITLDKFLSDNSITFIKADIEGAEMALLKGAAETLKSKNLKIVLCTYHKENDADDIKNILEDSGFETEFSNGYMLFCYDEKISPPYLRRGVIKAKKKD